MKVGGIRSGETRSTGKSSKGGKAEKGAFDRELRGILEESEAAPLEGAGPLSGVDGLLALQEAGDATTGGDPENRRRQTQRGTRRLELLEHLPERPLEGAVPKGELVTLARAAREARGQGLDPELDSVLDDIELRVEVELAKLTRR
jgi:hypothetical protein